MDTKAILTFVLLFSLTASIYATAPVRVIFDTDLATDCDDAGAVAMLHALADDGRAELLAMGVSTLTSHSILALDALNTWYGRPDIPIGTTRDPGAYTPDPNSVFYARQLAEEYPRTHPWKSPADAPDVAAVYRQMLAAEPDIDDKHPGVVLITVGMLTNSRSLLKSGPCDHSPLTGLELVKRKIRLWVIMGGSFKTPHDEYNIAKHTEASRYALDHWPAPVVFSPAEIGHAIITGTGLQALPAGPGPDGHILRRAYQLHFRPLTHGRHSWDQAAVLYAVLAIDNGPAADHWTLSAPGRVTVTDDGTACWEKDPSGLHRYKIQDREPALIAEEIEALMRAGRAAPDK